MKFQLALLDMYDGHPNMGMNSIRKMLDAYSDFFEYDIFDVRGKAEVPNLSYDAFISTGGPGSPLDGDGIWDERWRNLVDSVWNHNKTESDPAKRKYFFFICHSFQMVCHHFSLGTISKRKVPSFGIYPCHKTETGKGDRLLRDLEDPYWVVDIRDWQLIKPRRKRFKELGAQILSLEKIRTHVEYERAILAIRFSEEMVGTQYHPEAEPYGMRINFAKPENREKVLKNYSERKYKSMMNHLEDPEKIDHTHRTVIPAFLENAIYQLGGEIKKAV